MDEAGQSGLWLLQEFSFILAKNCTQCVIALHIMIDTHKNIYNIKYITWLMHVQQ